MSSPHALPTTGDSVDWVKTESRGLPVTQKMREDRARWIARQLNDHHRWLTHGRGIDLRTLQGELKLKIRDLGETPELRRVIWDYFWFLRDHMSRNGFSSFVHSRTFF